MLLPSPILSGHYNQNQVRFMYFLYWSTFFNLSTHSVHFIFIRASNIFLNYTAAFVLHQVCVLR